METDRAFAEIFEHRPDWLGALAGWPFPLAKAAQPKVFKPKIECDLVLEPIDSTQPHCVIEFQFYYDASILVRTDAARLAEWRRVNRRANCLRRNFVPRPVEAFVFFGERSHLPDRGDREFGHIRYAFLEERLAALAFEDPRSPLLPLLAPVVATSNRDLELRVAEDYKTLKEHPGLEEKDRVYFIKIFLHFLTQRFATKDANQLKAMIKELVPLENTVVYREMVEKGRREGLDQGREEGREEGRDQGLRIALQRLIDAGMAEADARRLLGLATS
jgi:predicted transposase YdaD